ncbi:MAG TPA: class I SAM-dependent methyltransferase [Armatimonadota bacterium]|jgi:SAM-dependent methyltransferase
MNPVEEFYDQHAEDEWTRLERHRLEFALSLRAMERHLPAPPARVADIGGGAGRYAITLAQRGYSVTLADLSPACLDVARCRAAEFGADIDRYLHADARNLSALPDAGFDAVLLQGPLYHLLDRDDRLKALQEASRILRPGGFIFAGFLGRYNALLSASVRAAGYVRDAADENDAILAAGLYRRGDGQGFVDAWFAHPTEIPPLMAEAGFAPVDFLACESILAEREALVNAADNGLWERWLDILSPIARDPYILGAAEHMLWIGRKAPA